MKHVTMTILIAAAIGCTAETEAPQSMPDGGGAGRMMAATAGGAAGAAGSKAPADVITCLIPPDDFGPRWTSCTLSEHYDPAGAQRLECVTIGLDPFAFGCVRPDMSRGYWYRFATVGGGVRSLWNGAMTITYRGTLTQHDCGSDPEAERQLEVGWCPAG